MVKVSPNTEFIFHIEGSAIFENVNNNLIRLNDELEGIDLPLIIFKRINSISIELLYNIIYHAHKLDNSSPDFNFKITSNSKNISIISSNLISFKEVEDLREFICHLNTLSFEELRKIKAHRIKNGNISKKGGAGLGLIDIAMKSRNPINMTYKTINKDADWLTLEIKIDLV